jgi:Spy/CpxP family protein refolding chaperone
MEVSMNGKERLARTAIPLALALLFGLAPALCLAEPGGGPPGPPDPEMMIERMTEQLGLTEQQSDDLEAVFAVHRKAMRSVHEATRTARENLDTQVHAATFDEAAIRKAAGVLAVLEADRAVAQAKLFQEIRRILTPEQLQKLEQIREERRERMGPGRGEHLPGPGPETRDQSF